MHYYLQLQLHIISEKFRSSNLAIICKMQSLLAIRFIDKLTQLQQKIVFQENLKWEATKDIKQDSCLGIYSSIRDTGFPTCEIVPCYSWILCDQRVIYHYFVVSYGVVTLSLQVVFLLLFRHWSVVWEYDAEEAGKV